MYDKARINLITKSARKYSLASFRKQPLYVRAVINMKWA